jgi:D-3-phosphoglycerate dehydrogenase
MTLMDSQPKILVITPVRHIAGVAECLEAAGQVTYLDDPMPAEVIARIHEYDALYTNPNKSRVYVGRELMNAAKRLKVICTASTGTNHIDKAYAAERGMLILALTEERQVIRRISSTAELAFALTMASLRHVVRGHIAVMQGEWDYTGYIGRQMNCLTIGVIGYGRLGQMYAGYCKAFGSRVVVYDPYETVEDEDLQQVKSLNEMLPVADVVALHVHVTPETEGMINAAALSHMKEDALLVNTSRGDVVNEEDLVAFLRARPQARVATDVLRDEIRNRLGSPLLRYASESAQVIITPHIGGMTREAQEIAYVHAAARLRDFFSSGNQRT